MNQGLISQAFSPLLTGASPAGFGPSGAQPLALGPRILLSQFETPRGSNSTSNPPAPQLLPSNLSQLGGLSDAIRNLLQLLGKNAPGAAATTAGGARSIGAPGATDAGFDPLGSSSSDPSDLITLLGGGNVAP